MNEATEEVKKIQKIFFFAIEPLKTTSNKDIEDMCALLSEIAPRYNMKWCQAVWKEKYMKRLHKNGSKNEDN